MEGLLRGRNRKKEKLYQEELMENFHYVLYFMCSLSHRSLTSISLNAKFVVSTSLTNFISLHFIGKSWNLYFLV